MAVRRRSITKRLLTEDEILNHVVEMFEGRVGTPYSKEQLEKIIEEGKERYKGKIPPGFKDSDKHGDTEVFAEICQKFGDLIIWKQVIEKSKESKKGIIFVTDDILHYLLDIIFNL